jgi:hypothetical protein
MCFGVLQEREIAGREGEDGAVSATRAPIEG